MKTFLILTLMLSAAVAGAQEKAVYRITYDCDARHGQECKTYRWTLDIGQTTAVFFNANHREKKKVLDELAAGQDPSALLSNLSSLGSKYPNTNPLEILIHAPAKGMYTYKNTIVPDYLYYEEALPATEWRLADGEKSICGYACSKAEATVHGRTWTVWYTSLIPLSYGPYVLGGLPGLILEAVDSEEIFHFTAAGLEQAPDNAVVGLFSTGDAIRCTRGKYLELREAAAEKTMSEQLRNLGATIVRAVGTDGKEIDLNATRPRKNYLDKE